MHEDAIAFGENHYRRVTKIIALYASGTCVSRRFRSVNETHPTLTKLTNSKTNVMAYSYNFRRFGHQHILLILIRLTVSNLASVLVVVAFQAIPYDER